MLSASLIAALALLSGPAFGGQASDTVEGPVPEEVDPPPPPPQATNAAANAPTSHFRPRALDLNRVTACSKRNCIPLFSVSQIDHYTGSLFRQIGPIRAL